MALKLIEQHHFFAEPGIITGQKVDVGGVIHKGQATVVLRGIEPSFNDGEDHFIKIIKIRITNVKPRDTFIEYDIEFDFMDDSNHKGSSNVDVLVVAAVD